MNISTSIAIVAIVIGITSMGLVLYDDDDYIISVTRDIPLFSQVDENIDEDKFGMESINVYITSVKLCCRYISTMTFT